MSELKNKTKGSYRDTVFRTLFHEPKRSIELCNALVGTDYGEDTPVEIHSLDPESSLLARFNDVAFSVENQLIVMCEHQHSINPNMPLRFLPYITDTIYSKLGVGDRLYGKTLITIPTPKFFVLYNGEQKLEEAQLHLSSAFASRDTAPSLELAVTVIDINRSNHAPVLDKSPSLSGYATLVAEVETRIISGVSRDRAIKESVEFCIANGILTEFLKKNYEEVCKMLGYAYDAEAEARVIRQENRQEGLLEVGKNLLFELKLPTEQVEKATGLSRKEIDKLLRLS